jgi:glycosyl transferase, family 25
MDQAVKPLIYVVNLVRDVARREWIQSELDKLHLVPTFIPAVMGRDLSLVERDDLYDATRNKRDYHSGLTAGEIGCYASHVLIWKQLLASGANWALVLEDDMSIAPELIEILQHVESELDAQQWDMIKLIGRTREAVLASRSLGQHQLIRYRRVPSLTGAFLLSRAGASKLLATRVPFTRPVDVDLRFWWENDLRMFGITPYPCVEAPIGKQSSIGMRAEKQLSGYRWRRTRFNIALNWRNMLFNRKFAASLNWPFR